MVKFDEIGWRSMTNELLQILIDFAKKKHKNQRDEQIVFALLEQIRGTKTSKQFGFRIITQDFYLSYEEKLVWVALKDIKTRTILELNQVGQKRHWARKNLTKAMDNINTCPPEHRHHWERDIPLLESRIAKLTQQKQNLKDRLDIIESVLLQ